MTNWYDITENQKILLKINTSSLHLTIIKYYFYY